MSSLNPAWGVGNFTGPSTPAASEFGTEINCWPFRDTGHIRRRELNDSIRRLIKHKEQDLGRRCTQIWLGANRINEHYIFSRFIIDRTDHIIVTLAAYLPHVGWLPQR